jgi:hypothetical protein
VAELTAAGRRDRRVQWTFARRQLCGIPLQPLRAGEFVVSEEARLPVPHGHPELVAGVAVIVKEEQADTAVLGMPVDMDLIPQRLASGCGAAVVGELTSEQPVHALAAAEQVDPEPADEQQVSLSRLDHQPGGQASRRVQVPAVPRDVSLGPDRARSH